MRRWVRISAGAFVTTLVAAGVIAYTTLIGGPPANSVAPAITGTDQVGAAALVASTGTWSGTPTSYSYQWQRADNLAFTTNVTNVGTNTYSYSLVVGDDAKYHRVVVTATNDAGSRAANSAVIGPTSAAAGFTARVFVAVPVAQGGLGNDSDATNCARVAAADAPPGGADHGCASFAKACSLASGGDTIKVYGGIGTYPAISINYPAQTILRSNCNPASDVSFKGATGETANVDGYLRLGSGTGSGLGSPSHLSFDGINITDGAAVIFSGALADSVPTNITYKNAHISCMDDGTRPNPCQTHLFYIKAGDTVLVRNVVLGPMSMGGDLSNIFPSSPSYTAPANVTFDNVDWHDVYDTCRFFPAALTSQGYTCVGLAYGDVGVSAATLNGAIDASQTSLVVSGVTNFPSTALPFKITIGTEHLTVTGIAGSTWTVTRGVTCNNNTVAGALHADAAAITLCDDGFDHVDALQSESVHGLTIKNSRVYALNPGRPVSQGLFFEAVGCTDPCTSDVLIQNTAVQGNGTCSVCIDGSGSSHYSGFMRFYNDTFTSFRLDMGDLANGATLDIANSILGQATNGNGGSGWSCTWTPGSGSVTVIQDYNLVPTGKNCGAHDIQGSATFVSTDQNNPDYRLSGAQAAIDAGTAVYCPATDAFGTSRPIGVACDLGFHEAG